MGSYWARTLGRERDLTGSRYLTEAEVRAAATAIMRGEEGERVSLLPLVYMQVCGFAERRLRASSDWAGLMGLGDRRDVGCYASRDVPCTSRGTEGRKALGSSEKAELRRWQSVAAVRETSGFLKDTARRWCESDSE